MQVSAVKPHEVFMYNGKKHSLDLDGHSGSGKVAVKNVETGEKFKMHHATKVELYNVGISEERPTESGSDDVPNRFDSISLSDEYDEGDENYLDDYDYYEPEEDDDLEENPEPNN